MFECVWKATINSGLKRTSGFAADGDSRVGCQDTGRRGIQIHPAPCLLFVEQCHADSHQVFPTLRGKEDICLVGLQSICCHRLSDSFL